MRLLGVGRPLAGVNVGERVGGWVLGGWVVLASWVGQVVWVG